MFKNFGWVILFCTIIIGMLILYECKKHSRKSDSAKASFWAREARANTVRRKDISNLNYINIPDSVIPSDISPDLCTCKCYIISDDEINEYRTTLLNLQARKILNLSGLTNTDLKEKYGVANLSALSEYDENYITLVNIIARCGARLIEIGNCSLAAVILEYGISIGTDVSRNYYMLAELYRKDNNITGINSLIESADKLDSIMKAPILSKLNEIKAAVS